MDLELGYISGMLAAKGHINIKKDFYISIETSDLELVEIAKRFLSLFGNIKITQKERGGLKTFLVMLRGNGAKHIASHEIITGRREWNVPPQAFTSEEFRIGFLRAFFDFSGTIKARLRKSGQKERVMKVSSINEKGLKHIKALLELEGIKAMVYKSCKSYVLEINGKNNLEIFLRKIGFEKNSKKETLKRIIDPVEFGNFLNSSRK
jgi:hypothetical protein